MFVQVTCVPALILSEFGLNEPLPTDMLALPVGSQLGKGVGLAEGEGLALGDGVALGDGLAVGEGVALGDGLAVGEGVGVMPAIDEGLRVGWAVITCACNVPKHKKATAQKRRESRALFIRLGLRGKGLL
ncbi:MAG: hypothetical protein ABIR71_06080 [Chthoniobacterales bacterium]